MKVQKFFLLEKIQHEKEIPFDEIDINNQKQTSNRISYQISSQKQLSMEIPSEPHGIGTNQYTYFVTNSPGLPWIKLPDVKPAIINHARKIRYLFTGCLSSQIDGISPFFGLEKDYLRAQIARITATTHISPAGFYILSENEEEEEEEEETSFNNERKGKKNNEIIEIGND